MRHADDERWIGSFYYINNDYKKHYIMIRYKKTNVISNDDISCKGS